MDPAAALELSVIEKRKPITEAIDKGGSDIQEFYRGTTVLVTGGTGFLGKLLIEKLLRSSAIEKIYIILRPKKEKTIHLRLSEIIKDPVFEVLCNEQPDFGEKITGIEGDMTQARLGINDEVWKTLTEEVNVIFHLAATIKFNEPLRNAIKTNLSGTNEVICLSRACKNLRALVHVSTAYSHAVQKNNGGEIFEEFYPVPATPEAMMKLADTNDAARLNDMTPLLIKDWPNTYSFTKALGEEAVRTMAEGLPVCIVRPSIIICTYKEPSPGWVDMSSVYGPSGLVLGTTIGVMHVVVASNAIKIDFTPADYAVNAIIAAGWETARNGRSENKQTKIYTVTNSRNILYWGDVSKILNNNARNFISPKTMWYCFAVHITMEPFIWLATCILHYLPGLLVDAFLKLTGRKPRLMKIYTDLYKMSNLLIPYTTNDWIFDNKNLRELHTKMSDVDRVIFNFDVGDVNWIEMILVWVVGLRKYIVKDDLKDTAVAIKMQKVFKPVTLVLAFSLAYGIWKILNFTINLFYKVFV